MAQTVAETLLLGGFAKAYTLPTVMLLNVGLTSAMLWRFRGDLAALGRDAFARLGDGAWSRAAVACAALAAGLWAGSLVWTYRVPVPGYDATTYHLPIGVLIAQEGGIDRFAATSRHINELPRNGQFLFARQFLLVRNELPIHAIQWLFGAMGVLALYGWMRQWAVPRAVAMAMAPQWLLVPAVVNQALVLWGTVDLIFHALLLLGFAIIAAPPTEPAAFVRRVLFGVAALALAIGTKGQGLLIAGPVLAFALAMVIARWRVLGAATVMRGAAAAVALVVLFGADSYVRNTMWFGNPFSPIQLKLGDKVLLSGPEDYATSDFLYETKKYTGEKRSGRKALMKSWKAVWAGKSGERLGEYGLAWWLVMLPGAAAGLVVLALRRSWWQLALMVLIAGIYWKLPGNWWARFVLFIFGGALVLAALALSRIANERMRLGLSLAAFAVSAVAGGQAWLMTTAQGGRALETKSAWRHSLDVYEERPGLFDRQCYTWCRDNLPADSRTIYFHPSPFDIHHYYFYRRDTANRVVGLRKAKTREELRAAIAEYRATHIVVQEGEEVWEFAGEFGELLWDPGHWRVYRVGTPPP